MPPLGHFGLGLRRAYAQALCEYRGANAPDFVEVTPENWLFAGGEKRATLLAAAKRYPLVSHSVSLNVGGIGAWPAELVAALDHLHAVSDAPFFSDHLCFSSAADRPLHELLPLPFSDEAVAHTAKRARELSRIVGKPFALENATYYARMPGSHMDEGEFILRTLAESDCGLLLDVNNVYVNCLNHGGDPRAFIDRLPMERVWQLHVAGHTRLGDVVIDTHIGPVPDPVWALYEYTLGRAGKMIPTVVEWDQDVPPLAALLDELDRARAAAARALGGALGGRLDAPR